MNFFLWSLIIFSLLLLLAGSFLTLHAASKLLRDGKNAL